MKRHAGRTLRIALIEKESRPAGSWIVVESARPTVSTTTETTKRLGSPGGRPGIWLPGCSFTTSIMVDARFPSTSAIRSTQSSEAVRGVACERAEARIQHTRENTPQRIISFYAEMKDGFIPIDIVVRDSRLTRMDQERSCRSLDESAALKRFPCR